MYAVTGNGIQVLQLGSCSAIGGDGGIGGGGGRAGGGLQQLTVWANSLGVEEEDALVHDATNGTSSRHQPTGQTT